MSKGETRIRTGEGRIVFRTRFETTVVSIWPTINPASENYTAMNEANMLIRTENGQFGTFDF